MTHPALLSIFRQGQTYTFYLQPDKADRSATAIVAAHTVTAPDYAAQAQQVNTLLRQLQQQRQGRTAAAQPSTQERSDPLLALGRLVYRQLVPPIVQDALAELPVGSSLWLASHGADVPWELAHDGNDYLATRFAISRQLLLLQWPRSSPQRSPTRWSALLIGNPTGDLPATDEEIERLAHLIESTPGTAPPRILMRRRATKETILQEFASGTYDLIHYAGHADFDLTSPDASGLRLARGQIVSAAEIQRTLGGQPVVMLNGCESARLADHPAEEDTFTYLGATTQGLAAAFVQGGARGVLGALWPIHDGGSAAFALAFYRTALQGATLSAAARSARSQLRQEDLFNPRWAAYTLYAHPDCTLALPTARRSQPATVLALHVREAARLFAGQQREEAAAALDGQVARLTQHITHYGGQARFAPPDMVIGIFGAPQVHQNDAERAATAALEIVAEMQSDQQKEERKSSSALGIGMSSGDLHLSDSLVDIAGLVVHEAVNLARTATTNQAWITASAQGLLRQSFDLQPGGRESLDAHAGGQPLARLVGRLHARHFLGAQPGHQRTLVGRTREVAALQQAWQTSCHGRSQLVSIVGEAGIGKSHLVYHFHRLLAAEEINWLAVACPTAHEAGPYELITRLLHELLARPVSRPSPLPDGQSVQEAVEHLLYELWPNAGMEQPRQEARALLVEFLSLADARDRSILPADADARQRRLANLLGRMIAHEATTRPVILVLEDLHHGDDASLDLLHHFFVGAERLPLLVLALFRTESEWQPPWWNRRNCQRLSLDALDEDAVRTLLAELLHHPLSGASLEPEMVDLLLARSSGNPFFLCELVTALQETGILKHTMTGWSLTRPLQESETPATVQRVLLTRIASLSAAAQQVLALAAVIGDPFSEGLLGRIVAGTVQEAQVDAALREIAEHGFVFRHWGEEAFHFNHAIVREVAYARLLLDERQRYHRRTGEVLAENSAEPDLLAHHFYQSIRVPTGTETDAISSTAAPAHLVRVTRALVAAGQHSQARYAARAALRHYSRALLVAEEIENPALELLIDVYAGLGAAQQTLTALDDALSHLVRAYELLQADNFGHAQRHRAADIARRIAQTWEWKSGYEQALRWLEQGLTLVTEQPNDSGDEEDRATAAALHIRLGSVHYNRGDLEAAATHCQHGLARAAALGQVALEAEAHNILGVIHDVQGLSDAALNYYMQSFTRWQALGDRYQSARVEDNLGQIYFYRGEWAAACEHLQHGYSFWLEIEDQYNLAFASLNLGMVALRRGEWIEAEERFMQSLAIWERTQNQRWTALGHTNMGWLKIEQGEWSVAREHLVRARERLVHLQVRDLLAECLCGLGEVALGEDKSEEAAEWAQEAHELAHEQGMRLEQALALRTLGKARLAQGQSDLAVDALQQSLGLLTTMHNEYEVARTLVHLARLQRRQGQVALAQANQEEALRIFRKLGAYAERNVD